MADSGLVVVVIVISLLLVTVFLPLLTVQYEWCQVLFDNNTVSIRIIPANILISYHQSTVMLYIIDFQ